MMSSSPPPSQNSINSKYYTNNNNNNTNNNNNNNMTTNNSETPINIPSSPILLMGDSLSLNFTQNSSISNNHNNSQSGNENINTSTTSNDNDDINRSSGDFNYSNNPNISLNSNGSNILDYDFYEPSKHLDDIRSDNNLPIDQFNHSQSNNNSNNNNNNLTINDKINTSQDMDLASDIVPVSNNEKSNYELQFPPRTNQESNKNNNDNKQNTNFANFVSSQIPESFSTSTISSINSSSGLHQNNELPSSISTHSIHDQYQITQPGLSTPLRSTTTTTTSTTTTANTTNNNNNNNNTLITQLPDSTPNDITRKLQTPRRTPRRYTTNSLSHRRNKSRVSLDFAANKSPINVHSTPKGNPNNNLNNSSSGSNSSNNSTNGGNPFYTQPFSTPRDAHKKQKSISTTQIQSMALNHLDIDLKMGFNYNQQIEGSPITTPLRTPGNGGLSYRDHFGDDEEDEEDEEDIEGATATGDITHDTEDSRDSTHRKFRRRHTTGVDSSFVSPYMLMKDVDVTTHHDTPIKRQFGGKLQGGDNSNSFVKSESNNSLDNQFVNPNFIVQPSFQTPHNNQPQLIAHQFQPPHPPQQQQQPQQQHQQQHHQQHHQQQHPQPPPHASSQQHPQNQQQQQQFINQQSGGQLDVPFNSFMHQMNQNVNQFLNPGFMNLSHGGGVIFPTEGEQNHQSHIDSANSSAGQESLNLPFMPMAIDERDEFQNSLIDSNNSSLSNGFIPQQAQFGNQLMNQYSQSGFVSPNGSMDSGNNTILPHDSQQQQQQQQQILQSPMVLNHPPPGLPRAQSYQGSSAPPSTSNEKGNRKLVRSNTTMGITMHSPTTKRMPSKLTRSRSSINLSSIAQSKEAKTAAARSSSNLSSASLPTPTPLTTNANANNDNKPKRQIRKKKQDGSVSPGKSVTSPSSSSASSSISSAASGTSSSTTASSSVNVNPHTTDLTRSLSHALSQAEALQATSPHLSPQSLDLPDQSSRSKSRAKSSAELDKRKIHECPLCHSKFQRPEHVKRHLRSHSSEKPFICPQPNCGKRFNRNDNLKQHLKKIHQLT